MLIQIKNEKQLTDDENQNAFWGWISCCSLDNLWGEVGSNILCRWLKASGIYELTFWVKLIGLIVECVPWMLTRLCW